jgi:hypothetical protein
MCKPLLDIYSQFLQTSFGQVSATTLSSVLEGKISHDQITRFLRDAALDGKALWGLVKSAVRDLEQSAVNSLSEESEAWFPSGVLVIDDHIEEKPYMKINGLVGMHWDHSVGRNVKGINQMSAVYEIGVYSIPVDVDFIRKTKVVKDKKTGKNKWVSEENKNEKFRKIVRQAVRNQLQISYIVADKWYSSVENMTCIKTECQADFVLPLKSNRLVALSHQDKQKGHYQAVESIDFQEKQLRVVYLKGIDFPVVLLKQVFTNKDGSTGCLFLVSSDLRLDYDKITAIYQIRWKVEEHHKSIKSNFGYAKSPAYSVKAQANHCILALYAFFEWEFLAHKMKTNHFALKLQVYKKALQEAWKYIDNLKLKIVSA